MAIKTFTDNSVLTAADTNEYLNNGGLVWISSTTFTTSSAVNVSNVFSSTYANYQLIAYWTQNTSAGTLYLKMRDGSGDISSNYGFSVGGNYHSGGVGTFASFNVSANLTQAQIETTAATAGNKASFVIDLIAPNLTQETIAVMALTSPAWTASLTRVAVTGYGTHNSATACTGFSLIPSAGTSTGVVHVYGYRQA